MEWRDMGKQRDQLPRGNPERWPCHILVMVTGSPWKPGGDSDISLLRKGQDKAPLNTTAPHSVLQDP